MENVVKEDRIAIYNGVNIDNIHVSTMKAPIVGCWFWDLIGMLYVTLTIVALTVQLVQLRNALCAEIMA
tara:strand:+ start:586 stop:792 length:207 start_codon:yes stop_codon:yes gene_type:complete